MPVAQDKGKSLIAFPDDYTVLDIETTGVSSSNSEIIEIGAVCVRNNEIVDEFCELVKPYRMIPQQITKITGITNDMVKDAEPIENVLPRFLRFSADDIIVGHNVSFDLNFIRDRADYFNMHFTNDFVDTMRLSRKFNTHLIRHRLSDLTEYFHITNKHAHRAVSDCISTHLIFQEMKKRYSETRV